jgi:c-di-GMP-binding flagellar brake protein YcgR
VSFWSKFFKSSLSKRRLDERRKYLRIDIHIPIQYSIIPKDKEEEIKQRYIHKAKAKNIGGGGLLLEIPLLTDELLLTTHLIKIKLTLPESEEPISAIARIVCVEKPEEIEGFNIRLEFISISDEDRERLIDFVRKHHQQK